MSTEIRPYDPEGDREDARRIWWEVGWLRKEQGERLDRYLANSRALVGIVEGQAECLVITAPRAVRHQEEELPFAGGMGVTTSHVARRQGLAKRTTALAASAGAFTRLWLGVRPATGLAFTDSLAGPPGLLEVLDGILRLPDPKPDWEH